MMEDNPLLSPKMTRVSVLLSPETMYAMQSFARSYGTSIPQAVECCAIIMALRAATAWKADGKDFSEDLGQALFQRIEELSQRLRKQLAQTGKESDSDILDPMDQT